MALTIMLGPSGVVGGATFGIVGGVSGGIPGGVVGGIVQAPGVITDPGPTAADGAAFAAPANGVMRVRVGGNVQSANMINKVTPLYPPLAKQARIQGTVRFTALIGIDGTVEALQLVSGHPLLIQSAQDAVKQWMYKPTLLNGNPVEVITQIDVNYTLSE
jgi:protein TonB